MNLLPGKSSKDQEGGETMKRWMAGILMLAMLCSAAALGEENAATLRNVIFRTKTYSPEVAAVIAGTSLLSPLSLSCPCKGHAPRVVGPL